MIRERAAAAAVGVAERIERTRGARAGLTAWKAVAAADTELRGKALVSALRCAVSLSDFAAVDELTRRWARVEGGAWDSSVVALCKTLARVGQVRRAAALAETEARRYPTALALYGYARCLEVLRGPGAAGVFADAAVRAEKEGRPELEMAARVRRAVLLARAWSSMGEALEEAQRVQPEALTPTSRMALARVLLRSPSRFTRASALGLLDQVIVSGNDRLGRRALSILVQWLDDLDGPVSMLEEDRLRALVRREHALALAPRLPDAVSNIVAMLASPPEGARLVPELADVVDAIRAGQSERAARALERLAEAEERGEDAPVGAVTVARLGLEVDDASVRAVATRIVEARLHNTRRGVPDGGFLRVADSLARAQMPSLAAEAYRAALVRKEPGVREAFGMFRLREGWSQARAGKREEATLALREAKSLLEPN